MALMDETFRRMVDDLMPWGTVCIKKFRHCFGVSWQGTFPRFVAVHDELQHVCLVRAERVWGVGTLQVMQKLLQIDPRCIIHL